MLGKAFVHLCKVSVLRKYLWHGWYGFLARAHPQEFWTFMNYGYAAVDGSPPLPLPTEDEHERYGIQLYLHLARGMDLRGRHVLEVGSGRGGGTALLHRTHQPVRMVGTDLADRAVAFCRHRHPAAGLEFIRGDAENLPFPAESFDAVFNVESSHCYASVPKFLAQVRRVLRPGGVFAYADFRDESKLAEWQDEVRTCGLTIEQERDITPNVLAALDADHDRKEQHIVSNMRGPLRTAFAQFAAMRDTPIYDLFRSGNLVYHEYRLRKTA